MTSNRKAFTMIELIFVIVVIGILSAIAVPKFAATRDDARVVASLASVKEAMNNVSAAYTARPSSVQHRQDWYGGTYDHSKKNGGCIAVFTYISGNEVRMYVSKYPSHNTCSLGTAEKQELYDRAERDLGVLWGKYKRKSSITNTSSNYYIEQLNGLRLDI